MRETSSNPSRPCLWLFLHADLSSMTLSAGKIYAPDLWQQPVLICTQASSSLETRSYDYADRSESELQTILGCCLSKSLSWQEWIWTETKSDGQSHHIYSFIVHACAVSLWWPRLSNDDRWYCAKAKHLLHMPCLGCICRARPIAN